MALSARKLPQLDVPAASDSMVGKLSMISFSFPYPPSMPYIISIPFVTQLPELLPLAIRVSSPKFTSNSHYTENCNMSLKTTVSCAVDIISKLPGELRNNIYGHIAKDDCLFIRSSANGKTFSLVPHYVSPMYNAPDNIKAEYIGIACKSASIIETVVYDFDFSHVETFLDTLSEQDIETLPRIDHPSSRRFIISLKLAGNYPLNLSNLHRWLDRFRDARNKVSEVEFEYEVPYSRFSDLNRYAIAFLTK